MPFHFFITLLITSAPANWTLSDARPLVVPGREIAGILPQNSNNNVSLERFQGSLYMVWRSSHDHFASKETTTHVVRSDDDGTTWSHELDVKIDGDVREAHLKEIAGRLHLFYFEGGTNPKKFEPHRIVHRVRDPSGEWSDPVGISGPQEVLWELKTFGTTTYKVSYRGPHYRFIPGNLYVKFEKTTDGETWTPVDGPSPVGLEPANPYASDVYAGGVCEVGFEADDDGDLWGIGRNEDGDRTGFGTQIFHARAGHWNEWRSLTRSLPERYDSPTMFKHHGELYLVARHSLGHPFDRGMHWLPFNARRWLFLGLYSLTKIRTALFHLNRQTIDIEWLMDLPSAGDNAFPSVVREGENNFRIANYSSPLQHTDWKWIKGQKSPEGTFIYDVELRWNPE